MSNNNNFSRTPITTAFLTVALGVAIQTMGSKCGTNWDNTQYCMIFVYFCASKFRFFFGDLKLDHYIDGKKESNNEILKFLEYLLTVSVFIVFIFTAHYIDDLKRFSIFSIYALLIYIGLCICFRCSIDAAFFKEISCNWIIINVFEIIIFVMLYFNNTYTGEECATICRGNIIIIIYLFLLMFVDLCINRKLLFQESLCIKSPKTKSKNSTWGWP